MKLITEIDDDVLFLSSLYNCVPVVERFMSESKISKVLTKKPVLRMAHDSMDEEQKEEIIKENIQLIKQQNKQNLKDALKRVMVEKPELTVEVLRSVIVLDEGEDFPHGAKLVLTAIRAFTNEDLLDFFGSLIDAGQLFAGTKSAKSTFLS